MDRRTRTLLGLVLAFFATVGVLVFVGTTSANAGGAPVRQATATARVATRYGKLRRAIRTRAPKPRTVRRAVPAVINPTPPTTVPATVPPSGSVTTTPPSTSPDSPSGTQAPTTTVATPVTTKAPTTTAAPPPPPPPPPTTQAPTTTAPPPPPPTTQAPTTTTTSITRLPNPSGWSSTLLSLVNQARADAGLAAVVMCTNLTQAAQAHSDDQARMNKMTHIGSDGSTLVVRLNRSGYLPASSWGVGENVAWNFSSPSSVMSAWMNSAGHRANILNPSFKHIGLGLTNFGGGYYWTQDFGYGGHC